MGNYWKEKQLAWRDMVWVVMIQSYKKGTYIHSTDFQMGDELHVIILHQKVYLKIQYLNVKRDRVYTWKPFIRNLQCSILFISIRINSKTKQNNKKTAHMHWKAWTSMHYHLPRWCWWWRISLPMQETKVQSLSGEDPLEKGMATHSSILGLENPMDRGAWWATVRGIEKSRTQL